MVNRHKKILDSSVMLPRTKQGKITAYSISQQSETIKCLKQKVSELPEVVYISNFVSAISDAVDGTPSTIAICTDSLVMLYNRYGFDRCGNKLQPNVVLDNDLIIAGTVLITSYDGYTLTGEQIEIAKQWLAKHSIIISESEV